MSDTFCILPFIHAATNTKGDAMLCCVSQYNSNINLNNKLLSDYWNSDYLKKIRLSMLKNEKIKECERCYKDEEAGYRSHRINENTLWKINLGNEYDEIINEVLSDGTSLSSIYSLDLRLGNTCNLACIMCKPEESSKWLNESKLLTNINNESLKNEWTYKSKIDTSYYEWYKNDKFWEDIKNYLPLLREIIIAGGEPLLIKQQLEFVKYISQTEYAENILIRYHTNGTIIPDYFKYWEKFKKVQFFFSVDGVGDLLNFVRYPVKWNDVLNNILKVNEQKHQYNITILYTVHALNIHQLPEFTNIIKNLNLKQYKIHKENIFKLIHPSLVYYPEYLHPGVLPPHIKERIYNSYVKNNMSNNINGYDKFMGVVNSMMKEDKYYLYNTLLDYTNKLKEIRTYDFDVDSLLKGILE